MASRRTSGRSRRNESGCAPGRVTSAPGAPRQLAAMLGVCRRRRDRRRAGGAESRLAHAPHAALLRRVHAAARGARPTHRCRRRAGVRASSSLQLHPPRGMIDLVISDDVDFSNGSATPYPTNRIIVYANPPVSESALRYTNDWGQMVITHELTHIFHLDRYARHLGRSAQHVFGRAALLFPNLYSPSWLTEGLAVYEESKLTGAGRVEGSEHRMIARAAAIDHSFPPHRRAEPRAGPLSVRRDGVRLRLAVHRLPRAHARRSERAASSSTSRAPSSFPISSTFPAKAGFGMLVHDGVARVQRLYRHAPSPTAARAPLADWRQLTHDGVYVFSPRWTSDSSIIYSGAPGRESFGAFRVDSERQAPPRRPTQQPVAQRAVRQRRLSLRAARLRESVSAALRPLGAAAAARSTNSPSASASPTPTRAPTAQIVAQQIIPGATRLVRVSPDGKRVTPHHRPAATTSSGRSRAGRIRERSSSLRAGSAATSRRSSSSTPRGASSTSCRAACRSSRRRAGCRMIQEFSTRPIAPAARRSISSASTTARSLRRRDDLAPEQRRDRPVRAGRRAERTAARPPCCFAATATIWASAPAARGRACASTTYRDTVPRYAVAPIIVDSGPRHGIQPVAHLHAALLAAGDRPRHRRAAIASAR